MDRRDRGGQSGGDAPPRGHVGRIDPIARQQRLDEGAATVDRRLAQNIGGAERQHTPHAGGQRRQGTRLGQQILLRLVVDGHTHHDPPAVVERGDGAVVAAGDALGQRRHTDHRDAGKGRRDRRG